MFPLSEYNPAIINDAPISEISFKSAIIANSVSIPLTMCGICIETIKMKSMLARSIADNLTNFLVIILMLAAINRIPVRIITYDDLGINEVNVPR